MKKEDLPFYNIISNKWFKYAVVFLVFLVFTFIVNSNNLKVWWEANRTIKAQSVQIQELKDEIQKNETMIRQLTSERDSLEKFAREQYLFHEKGEDVYVVSH